MTSGHKLVQPKGDVSVKTVTTGNIRLMPEQGVDIVAEPTKEQYDKLYDYMNI